MGLTLYKKKRTFNKTPEPTGGKAKTGELRFVIQKHDASRLHYDFRLEMEGVLKSWAVPKGPSLNPADRRLAMMVEDHPYDYRDFEGIIPEGNYGAGTVIVWDEGTYEPLEPTGDKKEDDKLLRKQLHAGSLKFTMHGKKLKGEFALVKIKGKEDNAWLLIKHKDKYASDKDITLKNKSVLSNKTIEQIEKTSTNTWKSNRKSNGTEKKNLKNQETTSKKVANVKEKKANLISPAKSSPGRMANKGTKAPFPKTFSPMLATLVDKPFDEPGWSYEIKWDGYRAVALCNKNKVSLISRNNKSFDDKFYPIHKLLKDLNLQAILDGEIVVLNDKGLASFGSLQNWRSEADGHLVYYVFDIVWHNGYDLTQLTLTERREILKDVIPNSDQIRLSETFDTSATEFLKAAAKMDMEGIMAKKDDSLYTPGIRTREWLKIKANKRHEVVIGGYTVNEGTSKKFSSLLVGLYEKGRLKYIGKVGTGWSDKMQAEILAKMKPLETSTIPFTSTPDIDKPSRFRPNPPKAKVYWLKPKLVAEVSYAELTDEDIMRHPSFEGLREDKSAKDVVPEKEIHLTKAGKPPVGKKQTQRETKSTKKGTRSKASGTAESANTDEGDASLEKIIAPVKNRDRKSLLNPTDETQVRIVNGHELKFSNLSKVYWPKEGYTKRDMLNYYYQVAPYLLPYLKNRPQSLNRYPNGINGKSFYQKDITGKAPDWIKMEPYTTSEGEDKNFLVPHSDADILYMANLGAIEMNPWNSTVEKPDHPDWCMIDLDPTDRNTWEQVIKTAQVTKEVLDELGVPGYPKTSGSTGIHIYIPMGAKYTYDECQMFGKLIAKRVHEALPKFTTIERLTKNRGGKMYVDYLQNRAKATLAAPYSLRPKPGATVSMPLYWEEIKKGMKMKDYNIENAMERIRREGDIFKPVLGKGINLEKILKTLNV
jgi:bifunctional non-homologous end joining protein LigD